MDNQGTLGDPEGKKPHLIANNWIEIWHLIQIVFFFFFFKEKLKMLRQVWSRRNIGD
jgi:hypothetical protein